MSVRVVGPACLMSRSGRSVLPKERERPLLRRAYGCDLGAPPGPSEMYGCGRTAEAYGNGVGASTVVIIRNSGKRIPSDFAEQCFQSYQAHFVHLLALCQRAGGALKDGKDCAATSTHRAMSVATMRSEGSGEDFLQYVADCVQRRERLNAVNATLEADMGEAADAEVPLRPAEDETGPTAVSSRKYGDECTADHAHHTRINGCSGVMPNETRQMKPFRVKPARCPVHEFIAIQARTPRGVDTSQQHRW